MRPIPASRRATPARRVRVRGRLAGAAARSGRPGGRRATGRRRSVRWRRRRSRAGAGTPRPCRWRRWRRPASPIRAGGGGKGTLYRRFPDRASIAVALLDEHERALREQLLRGPPPLGPGAPPAERLAAFYAAIVRLLERHVHLALGAKTGGPALRHRHLRVLARPRSSPAHPGRRPQQGGRPARRPGRRAARPARPRAVPVSTPGAGPVGPGDHRSADRSRPGGPGPLTRRSGSGGACPTPRASPGSSPPGSSG